MPEEIAVLTVITVVVGTIMITSIARMFFKYLGQKAGVRNDNSSSLTSSELEGMLRRVVDEANAPILARVEGIENQLAISIEAIPVDGTETKRTETKSLPSYKKDPILEDLDAPHDLAAISKRKSHTV